ncbi:MAG: B12-binding domain-containing radical SAM protein [Candidatus Fermentibacteraceae bacterium]|nr:B12-binding domain-containing radical SAM protein [Candidatus Fermentibacteraceae bacterium]MBN2609481.1 B12-binding domain-containing radical SAM protein [Candidatus Fermentibacteraceae bacterium]
MKIALVYPRWDWIEYNGLAEPVGLLQLVSALRSSGHDVEYLDYSFCRTIDELDGRASGAGLVGVAISAAAKMSRAEIVTNHLRRVVPDAMFLAGGAYPSIFPADTMERIPFDYVLTGEAEESIVELADALDSGKDPSGMMNLVYRRSGKIIENPRRPVPSDLDSLPFPARDVVDYDSYMREGMSEYGVVTTRGCPFNCIYCKPSTDFIFGGNIRYRSAENVVEEIAQLAELRPADSLPVFFKDDTITMHPSGWFEDFRDLLSGRGIRLCWHCNSRVDTVTREKVRIMGESGCSCISFGVESGSQKILDFYRKGTTPQQAEKAFAWCHEFGIEATANLMIGFPMENEEDLMATYQHLKRLKPDDIIVYLSTAIPGRYIHDWAKENGYLANDTNPELLDPARNRACEVMNMRLPFLSLEDVISWKRKIERYRSWRKLTSYENILDWTAELLSHPGSAARKAFRVIRGLGGSGDGLKGR